MEHYICHKLAVIGDAYDFQLQVILVFCTVNPQVFLAIPIPMVGNPWVWINISVKFYSPL
jgi:hypothetical protein